MSPLFVHRPHNIDVLESLVSETQQEETSIFMWLLCLPQYSVGISHSTNRDIYMDRL